MTSPFHAEQPDWTLRPFYRSDYAAPVIRPDHGLVFDCPMPQWPVRWEARHTFNPAPIVKDGKIFLLARDVNVARAKVKPGEVSAL